MRLIIVALCFAVMAGCSEAPKEAPKPADPAKLPPGMSLGYKPPK